MNMLGDSMQGMKDIIEMSRPEVAAKILPKDTRFAITSQAYILAPGKTKASVFDPGAAQFKIVYLAVTDSEFVVLDAKREIFRDKLANVEAVYGMKSGYRETGIDVKVDASGPEAGVYTQFGGCVIKTAKQTLYLKNPGPITSDGQFASSVVGMNEGFSPLFKVLAGGGAKVEQPSARSTMVWWLLGLGVIAGMLYWLVIFKK